MLGKICLAALSCFMAAAFALDNLYAELPPPDELLYAGEDPVTGTGYGLSRLREVPARVEILDGEELRRYGYRDLGEALETLAGLYIMEVPGREGPGSTITMRGADPAQILLLIDDVPVGSLVYGWNDLLVVPLETVDRVEVIYGPDALRYGDGALAGAVHVYTMKGPRESARSELSAADGSFDTERYRFNFGMTARGVDIFFGGNRLFGHEPNTLEGISLYNIDARVGYRWGSGDFDIGYGTYRRRTPVLDRYGWDAASAPGKQLDYADRFRGGVRLGAGPGTFDLGGYFRREFLRFDDVYAGLGYAERAREGNATAIYAYRHFGGSLAAVRVGTTYREDMHSGSDGLILSGGLVEEIRPPVPILVRVGAAYDYYKDLGGAVSPAARVSFLPYRWLTVYGGYSAGVRFPPLEFVNRGADGDAVEKNRSLDAGVKVFAKGRLSAGAAVFRDVTENAWLSDENIRVRELQRVGGEFWADGRLPPDIFYWGASYGRVNVSYDDARPAAYKPSDTAFGRFGYRQRLFRGDLTLRAEVTANYVGRRRAYGYRDHGSFKVKYDEKTYLADLPAYWLLGAHFSVTFVSVEVFVDMENVNRSGDYRVKPEYYAPARVRTYVGFVWTMYD